MKHYRVILVIAMATLSLGAHVYKSINPDGVVQFSDQPTSDAEAIEIAEINTASSPPSSTPEEKTSVDIAIQSDIEIIRPKNKATIRSLQGIVPVLLRITPGLQSGQRLKVIFDDTVLEPLQQKTAFALHDVARGVHTLTFTVVDTAGNTLQSSAKITFYMQKPSVKRNVG